LIAEPKGPKTDLCFDFPESDRELVVLVPTPAAAYCYLFEALLWVALQRIPMAVPWDDGIDRRISTDDMDNAEPRLEFEPISDEECQRIGLPPNPEYAAFIEGDYHSRPEDIERLLRLDLEPPDRARLLADLEASRQHYEAVDAWDQRFEEFLELPKCRLFIALREGKILSAGKRIPARADKSFPERLEGDEWDRWVAEPWQQIPSGNWLSGEIDWVGCKASGRHASYTLVMVSTEQLMAAFPPTLEPAGQAVRIGDCYRLDDESSAARPGKRGRPSLDWDAFHIEMAKRVKAGSLPQKQEALIADMQSWCARVWKRPVGRSTLLLKIQPYYSAFLRQSENAL
jgi:hypothetical protein